MPANHEVLFGGFYQSQTKSSNKSEENKKMTGFLLTSRLLAFPSSNFSRKVSSSSLTTDLNLKRRITVRKQRTFNFVLNIAGPQLECLLWRKLGNNLTVSLSSGRSRATSSTEIDFPTVITRILKPFLNVEFQGSFCEMYNFSVRSKGIILTTKD